MYFICRHYSLTCEVFLENLLSLSSKNHAFYYDCRIIKHAYWKHILKLIKHHVIYVREYIIVINVLVVSEFNSIKELLRSALKMDPNIASVTVSGDNDLGSLGSKFSLNFHSGMPDIIMYDLDSIKKEPQWKIERMLNTLQSMKNTQSQMPSLIVVSSSHQLNSLQKNVQFIESYVITKPFTFKQVAQVVKNVWTSSLTC